MSRQRSGSQIQLVAVGKIRAPFAAASQELERRVAERRSLRVDEVPQGRGTPAEATRRKARKIREVLLERAHVVCLEQTGRAFASSDDFTRWLGARLEVPVPLALVIGGPDGLDAELARTADERRSLGPLTFPHRLARVVLLEQLYRAILAADGHPYPR